MKYEVINHFDVWGNRKDGYEVNNSCSEGFVELSDRFGDKLGILRALKEKGLIKKTARRNSCIIEEELDAVFIYEKDYKPAFTLFAVWEENQ